MFINSSSCAIFKEPMQCFSEPMALVGLDVGDASMKLKINLEHKYKPNATYHETLI